MRSGTSKRALYSLFSSKAILFDTRMRRYIDSLVAPVASAVFERGALVENVVYTIGNRAILGILSKQRQTSTAWQWEK